LQKDRVATGLLVVAVGHNGNGGAAAAALSLCSAPATPLAAFVVRVTLRILEVARLLPFGGEVAMEVLVAAVDAVELRMTSMD